MHRPGANPKDMQVTDFLCDFCARAWDGSFPMVEGHEGSLVCGDCLEMAYRALVLGELAAARVSDAGECTMCLEQRDEPCWRSPARKEGVMCARCVKQASGRLHKDADWSWRKPEAKEAE